MRKLVSVLFLIALATAACDDDAVAVANTGWEISEVSDEADTPATEEELTARPLEDDEGLPLVGSEEECSCGNFVDDDGDGLCDLGASGECRRARTGRCPCGSCAGGC